MLREGLGTYDKHRNTLARTSCSQERPWGVSSSKSDSDNPGFFGQRRAVSSEALFSPVNSIPVVDDWPLPDQERSFGWGRRAACTFAVSLSSDFSSFDVH